MKLTKSGKIHYLEPELFTVAGVSSHGFTTRHEGVSRQPYNSLNLGTTTLDAPHNVEGNRHLLAHAFGGRPERFVAVTQVHGVDLLVIDSPNPDFLHFQRLECDGIITNQPEVMIAVTVADCVPVLLLDPAKKVVAALHAGWKGTARNISSKAVAAMVSLFGSDPASILAAVGPAISPCCYQVDAPVLEAFRNQGGGYERFSEPAGDGQWRLDMPAANAAQLRDSGLQGKNIEVAAQCVSCIPELYFSYRRDNGDTGRQMGFIMLNKD
jgi:YfiH family protein